MYLLFIYLPVLGLSVACRIFLVIGTLYLRRASSVLAACKLYLRHAGLVVQWLVGSQFSSKGTNLCHLQMLCIRQIDLSNRQIVPKALDHQGSPYIYLLIHITCLSFWVLFIPLVDPDFHLVLNSFRLETFYKRSVGGDAVLQLLYV